MITGILLLLLSVFIVILVTLFVKVSKFTYKTYMYSVMMSEFIIQLQNNPQDSLVNLMKNALKVCINNHQIDINMVREVLSLYFTDCMGGYMSGRDYVEPLDDETAMTYYAMFVLHMENEIKTRGDEN